MEENTQLPVERTKDEILHSRPIVANNKGSDLYVSLESARIAMQTYADQYATKPHQANETIKVLANDNNRLKGEVEEEKRQHELSVKSLRYSLDQREAELKEAKKLLNEVFRKHESGLLPDRFIYEKIKSFLYGE